MNFAQAKKIIYESQHTPEVAEAIETVLGMTERLQKALALASRTIYDRDDCPATWFGLLWPECQKCKRTGPECWQRYFRERARKDQICRICGYTEDNPGLKCTWIEDDLCSRCAERQDTK